MKYLLSLPFALLAFAAPLGAAEYPDDLKTNGFVVGCQAWTFNRFTVFEAIEKTKATGGKVIEFFPGQALSPEQKDVRFGHEPGREIADAPAQGKKKPTKPLEAAEAQAVWDKVKAKLKAEGIVPVAYGVVGIPKEEAAARKIFEFAKSFGIKVINTEAADSIDTFEPLVKEFDIKVGFHDHPKRPENPNYRMWDPNYIVEITKGRDPRIGACADTGHWVRSGLKPVDCLRILKGRIVSSHLKDLHAPLPSGHDVVWGTGVSDVPAILAEFRAQNFEGPISVEYEYKQEDNLAEAKQCVDYIRTVKLP
jgi:sugar phosphate isomerase/epimerase